jgi:CRISPR type III-A-associated protein Csm2
LPEIRGRLEALTSFRDLAPEDLVALAEKAGQALVGVDNKINKTQIRKFHGHLVKQLLRARLKGDDAAREIRLLEYHLIYAVSREKKMQAFADLFKSGLKKVRTLPDLERFKQFFDATLAYHAYYGGRMSD